MTDRELLELAAKAAGMDVQRSRLDDPLFRDLLIDGESPRNAGQKAFPWNPLTDDGDALRLAVKLGMNVLCSKTEALCEFGAAISCHELDYSDDDGKATRRAIVRAAAVIGRAMP